MDELERFIRKHRKDFDTETPGDQVWDRIRSERSTRRSPRRSISIIKWAVAASVVAGLVVVSLVLLNSDNNQPMVTKEHAAQSEEQPTVMTELDEVEAYYASLINEQMESLSPHMKEDPGLEDLVKNNMSLLNSAYDELRTDLNDEVANEKIVEELIQNYRIRLLMLENLASQLKAKTELNNEESSNEINL